MLFVDFEDKGRTGRKGYDKIHMHTVAMYDAVSNGCLHCDAKNFYNMQSMQKGSVLSRTDGCRMPQCGAVQYTIQAAKSIDLPGGDF